MGGIIGSIVGAIVNSLIEKVFKPLVSNIIKQWKKKEKDAQREKDQLAANEDYDKVLANPESTEQERIDAYEKVINAGRKP